MKQNQQTSYAENFNRIWQILDRNSQQIVKNSQQIAKNSQEMAELKDSQKHTDKQILKLEKSINKIGSRFNERWGRFVESLVAGKLSQLLREKGIQVIYTHPNVTKELLNKKGEVIGRKEFDIIVVNGKEVVVVEVKTVLTPKKVNTFLEQYLKDFKQYFPDHKDRKIYGAVAYLTNEDNANTLAEEKGMFVIKATGNSAHIINKKSFKPKAFS